MGKVAAFLLAFKGLSNLAKSQTLTFGSIFTNHIFRNIVISLVATLGLYIIASIIFVRPSCDAGLHHSNIQRFVEIQFEPWHMITSFIQYLLMAPSYINVLNVYAVRGVYLFTTSIFNPL